MSNGPLKYEIHGSVGQGGWYRLYECEHITDGSYPPDGVFPVGSHTNMLICRHCWEGIKGQVAQALITTVLRSSTPMEARSLLSSLLSKEDAEQKDILQSAKSRDMLDTINNHGAKGSSV